VRKSIIQQYIEVLLISIILASFARAFLVQGFEIPSGSMEPTLLVGDHLLVNKFTYAPARFEALRRILPLRQVERGDIVVFRFPSDPTRDLVKRCVGIGGDEIELVDKTLKINGQAWVEPYVKHVDEGIYPSSQFLPDTLRFRDNFGPFLVPDGHLFCLGDNREDSNDSRFWGTVPQALVRGRALLLYWSEQTVEGPDGKLKAERRWQRSLKLIR
jgi:signal peptidase I